MKAKRALFIDSQEHEGKLRYWACSEPSHSPVMAGVIYFREGRKDLYPDSPTWFTSEVAAQRSLERMGFKLAEQPR